MGYDLEPQQPSSGMSIMSAGVTKVVKKVKVLGIFI